MAQVLLNDIDWQNVALMLDTGQTPDSQRMVDGIAMCIAPGDGTAYKFQLCGGEAWVNESGERCMCDSCSLSNKPAPSCDVLLRVWVAGDTPLVVMADLMRPSSEAWYPPEGLRRLWLQRDSGEEKPFPTALTLVSYVLNKLRDGMGAWLMEESVDEYYARVYAQVVSGWGDAPEAMLTNATAQNEGGRQT